MSARRLLMVCFALLVLAAAAALAQQARPTARPAEAPADDPDQAPADDEVQDADAPPPEEPDLEAIGSISNQHHRGCRTDGNVVIHAVSQRDLTDLNDQLDLDGRIQRKDCHSDCASGMYACVAEDLTQ